MSRVAYVAADFSESKMTDRYAVIGNPIEHSKSPVIHAAFAAQTGEDLEYDRILGDMEDFPGDVGDFFSTGGRGLNVTVPFKTQAYRLSDELSPRAKAAGAVNTLTRLTDNIIRGDNTDGTGLITDLACNQLFNFAGARILLLGAGGASRGVVRPLLEQKPDSLVVANRTASRAEQMAESLEDAGPVSGCGLDALEGRQFDLIINATAAGISGRVPRIPANCLADGGWIYDMMYASQPTAFVRWGLEQGAARALDGVGMLVEQAAESFYLWRNKRPDTEAVIKMLKRNEK